MCIAITKNKDKIIPHETLRTCFTNNPDGAGFATLNSKGKMAVYKGFFTFESFIKAWKPHEHQQALIHFRIKTHGLLNEENCHPFVVTDDLVFIHNGIISMPKDNERSDTILFNEQFIKPLVEEYGVTIIRNPIIQSLIEDRISSSKLAFLDRTKKEFVIMNEELGNYQDEVWFSNMSWKPYAPYIKHPAVYAKPPLSLTSRLNGSHPPFMSGKSRQEVDYVMSFDNKDLFREGESVTLTHAFTHEGVTAPIGSIGEIEKVYSDRTADVWIYDTNEFLLAVNLFQIKLINLSDTKYNWMESAGGI